MAAPKLEGRFVESTPEQIRATEEALAIYTRDVEVAPVLEGQPGKFRFVTKLWLGLIAGSLGALLFGDQAMLVGVLGLLFFVPALMITGINDMLQPSARDRRTPVAALKCFFRAVRFARWKVAFAALGAPAREKQVTVPKIKVLMSERGTVAMSDPKRVEGYWRTLARPSRNMARRITWFGIEPLCTNGNVHRYRVTVDFSAYKSSGAAMFGLLGQLATTKKFRTAFEVFVYRYRSQWWLYSGELGLPDRVAKLPAAKVVK